MLIVVAPRRSSIRISQGDTGAPCAASATAMNSFPVFLACASAAPGMPTAVAKRRHLCTRFAFNPCAIATEATDAPACAHCANTRDFSSTLCLRLGSRLDSCMVPTSFVGGHHLRYQRIRLQYATARRLLQSAILPACHEVHPVVHADDCEAIDGSRALMSSRACRACHACHPLRPGCHPGLDPGSMVRLHGLRVEPAMTTLGPQ